MKNFGSINKKNHLFTLIKIPYLMIQSRMNFTKDLQKKNLVILNFHFYVHMVHLVKFNLKKKIRYMKNRFSQF